MVDGFQVLKGLKALLFQLLKKLFSMKGVKSVYLEFESGEECGRINADKNSE